MKKFGFGLLKAVVHTLGWTVLLPYQLLRRLVLPRLSAEKLTRLGHLWMYFEVATLPAFFLALAVADMFNRHLPNWAAFVAAIEVICVYFAIDEFGAVLRDTHNSNLCEKCVAAFPLDAQEQAQRKRPWLKLWHVLAELGMAGAIAVLALMAIPAFTLRSSLALPLMVAVVAARGRMSHVHRTLHPVCPFCGHGGGGGGRDSEDSPAPAPEPVGAA